MPPVTATAEGVSAPASTVAGEKVTVASSSSSTDANSDAAISWLSNELNRPKSALGRLIIDHYMKNRIETEGHAHFKSIVQAAPGSTFAVIRKHIKGHNLFDGDDIYTFFQESCMEYFGRQYTSAAIPPGPVQDDTWNDTKFEAFCHAQLTTYGVDPVRLFLLKNAKLRQDTYRMAATLRRCELDINECCRERVMVDKTATECVDALRNAVLPDLPSCDSSPAFCPLWEQVLALRDSTKGDRQNVLQACITEQQWANTPGRSPSDYRAALSDLASAANKLWIEDDAIVVAAQTHEPLQRQNIGVKNAQLSSNVEARLATAADKLASLRSKLDDTMIRCQLSGGDSQRGSRHEHSTDRALMDTIKVVTARVTQNQDGLLALQEMKDSLMEAAATHTTPNKDHSLVPNAQMVQKAVPAEKMAAAKALSERRTWLRLQLEGARSARPCVNMPPIVFGL